jgi:phospholipid/cholesterol/gamma-HCH transport system substrate-binding protein
MSRTREIQVGITVLVAVAILLWGIAWLSNLAKSNAQRVWHVRFPQAGGLAEGNDAHVNGVRKGVVKSLRLQGDHVIVNLALSKDIDLTHDSRVVIRSVSMMGDKVIAVDYRATGAPWSLRDTIPGVYEKGLPEVLADVGRATGSISSIASELDSLALAARGGGLAAALESFQRTSRELEGAVAENRAALGATIRNLAAASESARELVADRQAALEEALDHFEAAAENLDRLSVRLDTLRASLQVAATKLDRGEGTLGKLVHDEQLYTDLAASVHDLRALIREVRANPRKYLRFSVF